MNKPKFVVVAGVAAVLAVGGWITWTVLRPPALPPGVAAANGRVEVERIDVATKLPGRVAEIRVKEGDLVAAGEVVAVLDTADLLAQRAAARATVARATAGIAKAVSDVAAAMAQLALAEVEMRRSAELLDKAVSPQSLLDQRKAQRDVAAATVDAARAAVADAMAARDAASAQVDLIQVSIDDMTLKAPTAGRVEYKLVDPGAVIGAGGKVATLLDLSDVTMTIFLPTRLVGRVSLGAPARIVLDAAKTWVVPATVSFVAAEAQFTPKSVETAEERDKLMYRVKVRIDPAVLDAHRAYVKSGLTGDVHLLTEPGATWPAALEVRLPKPGEGAP
ncbi:HlyD family efflux transporter periplasmic adaptor subunit [Siculibacillus lacustris]|uniref:HlyD family efflux transporter periplasmic adaptor subunit n=1 Tax=Siculibacillus lacustris TaxID=1549641 RepID=A0A4Q9VTU2_9HYPH|nr:HlyD family efflux transporter periplasmic adaptor subunit [Siculibacillus lacustris]TBW39519.1 HlyD family efflux transporter periplasmic adaptor subunit [Siculibacillus lacustris]